MFSIKFVLRRDLALLNRLICKTNLHRTVLFSRKSCYRNFSLGNVLKDKIYIDHENTYAYDVMKANFTKYKLTLVSSPSENVLSLKNLDEWLADDWSRKSPSELCESFNAVSNLAEKEKLDISLTSFDSYIDAFSDKMHLMSDSELELICYDLRKWPQTDSVFTRNFIEIWAALDDVFKTRLSTWEVDDILLFMDCMYKLHLTRKTEYVRAGISKICGKSINLTPQQLVQVMFYICTSRECPQKILNLELKLGNYIDVYSIDELSVICLGFFKCKTNIKDKKIVCKIMRRVSKEVENIDEITLCSILKLIRLSSNRGQRNDLGILLNNLTQQIHRLSIPACVQIAVVGSPMRYFHIDSLISIGEQFLKNPEKARLKDLERMAFAFSVFNVKSSEPFYNAIIAELKRPERKDEIAKYGYCLYVCLSYLAMANIYPEDLISIYLDEEKIKKYYPTLPIYLPKNSNEFGREILLLDGSLEIECENYKGNRLDKKSVKKLANKFTDFVPNTSGNWKLNAAQRLMLEIMQTLQKIRGGKQYVSGQHIIPHFQKPDVIVADDENGHPVNVEDYFLPNQYTTVQRVPDSKFNWYALIILKHADYTCNTGEILGTTNMKLRQLKKLGYIPKIVSWEMWGHLNSEANRIKYLKNVLKDDLKTEPEMCLSYF